MGNDQHRFLKALTPLLERYGGVDAWTIAGSPLRSRKCIIHSLSGPSDAPLLAIKEYRGDVVKGSAAFNQYNGLLFAAGLPRHVDPNESHFVDGLIVHSLVRATQPYAYLPMLNAIVMEWADAPTMADVIENQPMTQRRHSILSAARWLRGFHGLSSPETEKVDVNPLLERLRKRLDASEKYKNADIVQHAIREMERLAGEPMTAPHAYLHGDFTPSNILLGTDGPIGIDIWARRHAPVYEDVVRMLVYLASKGTGFGERSALVCDFDTLRTDFLTAYDATGKQCESDAFEFILLYQTIRRWLVMADWIKHRQPPLAARAKRKRMEGLLNALLSKNRTTVED